MNKQVLFVKESGDNFSLYNTNSYFPSKEAIDPKYQILDKYIENGEEFDIVVKELDLAFYLTINNVHDNVILLIDNDDFIINTTINNVNELKVKKLCVYSYVGMDTGFDFSFINIPTLEELITYKIKHENVSFNTMNLKTIKIYTSESIISTQTIMKNKSNFLNSLTIYNIRAIKINIQNTKLTELYFSNIKTIIYENINIPKLKKLELTSFNIDMNNVMKDFIYLTYLNLTNTSINDETFSKIIKFRYLETLILSDCKINRIPREIGNLRYVRILDLSNNSINKLPKSIGDMKRLEFLYLNDTKLKRLPKDFIFLNRLVSLTIPNEDMFYEDFSNMNIEVNKH